jgi:hypothetical protein
MFDFWGFNSKRSNIARAYFIHATVLSSNNLTQAVTLLDYTGDSPVSNLSRNTDYPEGCCL